LSPVLLPKIVKFKIYGSIISLLFCMGGRLGRSHLREECNLRLFENRVLRGITTQLTQLSEREVILHVEYINPYPANVQNMVS